MVVLASSITTKSGKALISRQFVPLAKARIEGLLAAFPKLIGTEKQHTFVETENVRYVYQPLEALYVVLITNKASNILEDLETLHLLAKIVPEFCSTLDESAIMQHAFELIFAFDEAIAMGYKERVNLQQIKQFMVMESHDENRARLEEENKLKQAKKELERNRKAIEKRKMEEKKFGIAFSSDSSRSISNTTPSYARTYVEPQVESKKESPKVAPKSLGGKGLQLSTGKKLGGYTQALKEENVPEVEVSRTSNEVAVLPESHEKVHINIQEKLILFTSHDGGLQNFEVKGELSVSIFDTQYSQAHIHINQGENKGFQFKAHPNMNKSLYPNVLALKDSSKSYPLSSPTSVLKWRFATTDEKAIPLTVGVWPSTSGGQTSVPIEYEKHCDFDLVDVVIAIPIPGQAPVVQEVGGGSYDFDSKKNILYWRIPLIDSSNSSATMEFTVPEANNAQFFPVNVDFTASQTFCAIQVVSVQKPGSDVGIDFSQEVRLSPEEYTIST